MTVSNSPFSFQHPITLVHTLRWFTKLVSIAVQPFGRLFTAIANVFQCRERQVAVAEVSLFNCRMVNIHVINTLGVAPGNVQKCIECWCSDERHRLRGERGGGSCCSEELCQSAEPSTEVNTYSLQFTVTYRYACCHRI